MDLGFAKHSKEKLKTISKLSKLLVLYVNDLAQMVFDLLATKTIYLSSNYYNPSEYMAVRWRS